MIEIVEGKGVGAGKSYYVCCRIIEQLAKGGTVCASDTFGLKWDAVVSLVSDRYGVVLESDQYRVFAEDDVPRLHEVTPQGSPDCPVLVVVDECHTKLNARDWNDSSKRPFFVWLTQSRHDDTDVMFISQAAANIDKQIVRLITYFRRCRNMATWKIPGLGNWPLKQFVIATLDTDGRTVLEKKWIWHDKGIFGCYESKVMRGKHRRTGEVVRKRVLASSRLNKKSRMFRYAIFLIPVLLIVSVCKLYGMFGAKTAPSVPPSAVVAPGAAAVRPGAVPAPGPSIVKAEYRGVTGGDLGMFFKGSVRYGQKQPWTAATDLGYFTEGEMSVYGLVKEVRWPNRQRAYCVIRCDAPGRVTYVVADQVPGLRVMTVSNTSDTLLTK